MGKFSQIISCWGLKLGEAAVLGNHYQWRSGRAVPDNFHLTSTQLSIGWSDEHAELIKLL